MTRYPLALYGPKGWDDLNDMVTVRSTDEEHEARGRGYSTLAEPRGAAEGVAFGGGSSGDVVKEVVIVADQGSAPEVTPAASGAIVLDEAPMYVRPDPFDWTRPWLTVRADLVGYGFSGKTKAEAVEWALTTGRVALPG